MAKIIIIGNSLAGFSCCEALLKQPQGHEITIVTLEKYPAYKRHNLVDFLKGSISEKEIFLCNADFYAKNNIQFLKESKVVKIDPKRRTVSIKDAEKLSYDYLVIASGQKMHVPEIPGKTKDGVFTLYNLEDAKEIKKRLMFTATACVVAEPVEACALADIYLGKDKEVKVISGGKPEAAPVNEKLEWVDSLTLSEIIGEGAELKAIKLSSGKAIGVDVVLFSGNYAPSTEFLKETDVATQDGFVVVNESLRTNWENIFSCGSVCRKENELKEKTDEEIINEALAVAEEIMRSSERKTESCQQTS